MWNQPAIKHCITLGLKALRADMTKPTHSDYIFLHARTHRGRVDSDAKINVLLGMNLVWFSCFSPLAESVSSRLKLTQGVNLLFCQFPDVPPHWLNVICILSSPHFGPAAQWRQKYRGRRVIYTAWAHVCTARWGKHLQIWINNLLLRFLPVVQWGSLLMCAHGFADRLWIHTKAATSISFSIILAKVL